MIHIPRRALMVGAAVVVPAVAAAAWAFTRDQSHVDNTPHTLPYGGGASPLPTGTPQPAPTTQVPESSSTWPMETPTPAPSIAATPSPASSPTAATPAVPAAPTAPVPKASTPAAPTGPAPTASTPATSTAFAGVSQLAAFAAPGTLTYAVKSGDTLSAIGRRYGVSVAALVAVNHIANAGLIRIGQVLTIPAGGTAPPAPKPAPVSAPRPAPKPAPAPTGQPHVAAGPAVYGVNTSKKLIALTFDDGPNGAYTDAILGVLAKHKVHATFFVLGQNVSRDAGRLRKEVAAGHAIGNHSWDHPQLTNLSTTAVSSELSRTSAIIQQVTGKRPDTFRAPYGAHSARVDAAARQLGMRDILWDVDTVDWSRPGTSAIANEAVASARKGSIILMHDGGGNRSQTVAALGSVITRLQAQGYQFVTVPQLMASGPAR